MEAQRRCCKARPRHHPQFRPPIGVAAQSSAGAAAEANPQLTALPTFRAHPTPLPVLGLAARRDRAEPHNPTRCVPVSFRGSATHVSALQAALA